MRNKEEENRGATGLDRKNVGDQVRVIVHIQVTNREPPVNSNFQTVNWAHVEATGVWSGEMSVTPAATDSAPVECKEHRSITAEARFEVDSFKDGFPDIYDQF
ncbi:hypothetical protein HAX54_038022 [Datura stramonium]|uniref:Uncharacterized protein n=1 Tax=Datura stramonium TaxID=4076 RepID=A0ABS8VJ76_DATST|nr:hypothetical protein [Datura stramonium]